MKGQNVGTILSKIRLVSVNHLIEIGLPGDMPERNLCKLPSKYIQVFP